MDLLRLAAPRRTYTQSHIDYVLELVRWVAEHGRDLHGYRLVEEPRGLPPLHRPVRAARLTHADLRAAPFEDLKLHLVLVRYVPWNSGVRFSRKARMPSW